MLEPETAMLVGALSPDATSVAFPVRGSIFQIWPCETASPGAPGRVLT